jgi:hypothetical protein
MNLKHPLLPILLAAIVCRAHAATLSVSPGTQTVTLGQQVHVDIMISDLGTGIVGAYDVVVSWDPAVLALANVEFDVFLGPGSHQDFDTAAGSVNVAEIAVSSLPPNQDGAGEFRLAALTFDTLSASTTALSLSGNISPSGEFAVARYGQPLEVTPQDGSIAVSGDSDADGVPDAGDNCTLVANADQRDTNHDGFGNACDPDLDNDGITNFSDLGLFKVAFFTTDPDADFDGDGNVNFVDLAVIKQLFFLPPGPSGLAQ